MILNDLARGKEGENVVASLLTKVGFLCCIMTGKNYDYDIKCELPPHEFTIEVKYDAMASKTGNIAIEYWNSKSNKPSGITVTKSDLWFHLIGNEKEVWVCRTSKIKEFIQNEKPLKIIYKGGDNNADMLLYEKEKFCSIAERVDNIADIELFRKIKCLACLPS